MTVERCVLCTHTTLYVTLSICYIQYNRRQPLENYRFRRMRCVYAAALTAGNGRFTVSVRVCDMCHACVRYIGAYRLPHHRIHKH